MLRESVFKILPNLQQGHDQQISRKLNGESSRDQFPMLVIVVVNTVNIDCIFCFIVEFLNAEGHPVIKFGLTVRHYKQCKIYLD